MLGLIGAMIVGMAGIGNNVTKTYQNCNSRDIAQAKGDKTYYDYYGHERLVSNGSHVVSSTEFGLTDPAYTGTAYIGKFRRNCLKDVKTGRILEYTSDYYAVGPDGRPKFTKDIRI